MAFCFEDGMQISILSVVYRLRVNKKTSRDKTSSFEASLKTLKCFLPFEALFCSCQNVLFGTTANTSIAVLGFVQIVLCYIPTPSQDDSEPVS